MYGVGVTRLVSSVAIGLVCLGLVMCYFRVIPFSGQGSNKAWILPRLCNSTYILHEYNLTPINEYLVSHPFSDACILSTIWYLSIALLQYGDYLNNATKVQNLLL